MADWTVKVTFTDSGEDTDSVSWDVDVEYSTPSVSRVSPSSSSLDIGIGDRRTFRARADDDDDDLSKWKWEARRARIGPDFVYSPGEQSFGTAPTGSVTKDFTYTFAEEGEWTVKITFTDAEGLSDSEEWDVDVENSDPSVDRVSPRRSSIDLGLGDSQTFRAEADDDDDNLSKWKWEARRARIGPDFVYSPGEQSFTTAPTGSVTKDFTYTFAEEGEWTVEVTFTDAEGESDSVEWDVDVENSAPSVSRVSPSSSSVDLETGTSQTFRASADDDDDNLSKWKWEARRARIGPDFVYTPGEQSFSTSPTGSVTKDFSYTFSIAGDWTVKVTFTDTKGESDSEEWEVTVNIDPSVSIVSPSSPVSIYSGNSQTFTASASDSDNNLKSYEWFVDGTSEDDHTWLILPTGPKEESFTHTFSTAGTYKVKVTFTDAVGDSDSEEWTVNVRDPASPSVSRVSPSSSSVDLETGNSQTFRASAEDDDDDLSKWKWEAKRDRIGPDFVYTPGEQSFDTSPTGSVTKDFSYTFSTAGDWTVKVTFTDSEGETGSAEWAVTVNIAPSVSIVSPSSPVSIYSGNSQTFTASASDSDNNLKRYEWFVDGTSEDEHTWLLTLPTGTVTEDYTHTFSTAGTYTVKVTFTDSDGAGASVSWEVNVEDPNGGTSTAPSVSIVSPSSSSVELETGGSQTFTAHATDPDNNLKSYEWFVNGISRDDYTWQLSLPDEPVDAEFSHRFLTAGNYSVTATFTDDDGQSESVTWDVKVTGNDLTLWSGYDVFSLKTVEVMGTCKVSPTAVRAGGILTLTATVTSISLDGKMYMRAAFREHIRSLVSSDSTQEAFKTGSKSVREGQTVSFTLEGVTSHAGQYDFECRLFLERTWPDVELKTKGVGAPVVANATVNEGPFPGGTNNSRLMSCGPPSIGSAPILAGQNVSLESRGDAGTSRAGHFSVRAYIYHKGNAVFNGFGKKNFVYFSGTGLPIFTGSHNFDSPGRYVMDCELYYSVFEPVNPFNTENVIKTAFKAFLTQGGIFDLLSLLQFYRGVLTQTVTVVDARWGDQPLSIVPDPVNSDGGTTLPTVAGQ